MAIPSNDEILKILDRLDQGKTADDLETYWLEFKPWTDGKDDLREAYEYAVCFANADGGAIVFGVKDRTFGRARAIIGVKGHKLDYWRSAIYQATQPNISVKVEELRVPEGTGRLLIVRVPKGSVDQPHGTASGLYKKRVGKNCMPLSANEWIKSRISSGAIDWSGAAAIEVSLDDLDPIEIARARNILQRINPQSELVKQDNRHFCWAWVQLEMTK